MAPLKVYIDPPEHQMTSSNTAAAELAYERSLAAVELLYKDEQLRKLRIQSHNLAHDLDDSDEQLVTERHKADESASAWQDAVEEANEQMDALKNDLRTKTRELDAAKAEIGSLQSFGASSSIILAEKLALSRELSLLKPELDHLRLQTAANESLLADKLSLQQQLSTAQAELKDERQTLVRLKTQLEKSSEADAKREAEVTQLKQELATEKAARVEAEEALEQDHEVEVVKRELTWTRSELQDTLKAKAKLENEAEGMAEDLERLQRDLASAQKAAAKSSSAVSELAELKQQLANEKKERSQADKATSKAASEWEAEKALLDDKLDQFRTKLRSTKELLKQTQQELQEAREESAKTVSRAAKGANKRFLAQADPDATTGTPGDARPAIKRNKRASSVVGEKSNFSITPLLARTRSIAPEGQQRTSTTSQRDPDEPVPSIEIVMASPNSDREQSIPAVAAKRPLAPASTGRANLKVNSNAGRKKASTGSTLEKVAEEVAEEDEEEGEGQDENTTKTITSVGRQESMSVKPRLSLKPKSLSSFASFREASLQPQAKKKRKLLGMSAKTIFDEDDEDEGPAKGVLAGGQRAFGAFGVRAFGAFGGNKSKGPLVVAQDGFMFSPLKKDRKAMVAAANGQ